MRSPRAYRSHWLVDQRLRRTSSSSVRWKLTCPMADCDIGKSNILTTAQGLKIAAVGGAYDEATYASDDNVSLLYVVLQLTTVANVTRHDQGGHPERAVAFRPVACSGRLAVSRQGCSYSSPISLPGRRRTSDDEPAAIALPPFAFLLHLRCAARQLCPASDRRREGRSPAVSLLVRRTWILGARAVRMAGTEREGRAVDSGDQARSPWCDRRWRQACSGELPRTDHS